MTQASPSTLRRDLIASYAAAGAKVGSWAVVTAVAFRTGGVETLALIALIRGSLGILTYATFGVAPALVAKLAAAKSVASFDEIRSAGTLVGVICSLVGVTAILLYAKGLYQLHDIPNLWPKDHVKWFAFAMGVGFLLRLLGDIPGSTSQVRQRLAVDQSLVATGEILWVAIVLLLLPEFSDRTLIDLISHAYAGTGALILVSRMAAAGNASSFQSLVGVVRDGWSTVRQLVLYGSLLTLAQLADFLYAPTDMILINRFVSPQAVAAYTPAIQIDAALLLLVAGLANVILPRAALAHAAGNVSQLRRDYVRGTLVSFTLLFVGAVVIWLTSPLLFKVWFNDPLPAAQAILPLVLIHTVVGGSSAVGRSILLGMGRVKPYTIAALLAGVSNVVLSYSFVRFFNLGLNGIVLGTIIVVVARCAIWMPWYVWRVLGKNDVTLDIKDDGTQATPIV